MLRSAVPVGSPPLSASPPSLRTEPLLLSSPLPPLPMLHALRPVACAGGPGGGAGGRGAHPAQLTCSRSQNKKRAAPTRRPCSAKRQGGGGWQLFQDPITKEWLTCRATAAVAPEAAAAGESQSMAIYQGCEDADPKQTVVPLNIAEFASGTRCCAAVTNSARAFFLRQQRLVGRRC